MSRKKKDAKYIVDHIWKYEEHGLASPVLQIGGKAVDPEPFTIEYDTYKAVNHHAYNLNSIGFYLFNTNHFVIHEVATKKKLGLTDAFTTSFEQFLSGVQKIDAYCEDWNVLAEEIKTDKAKTSAVLTFLIETYDQDFGAYYDWSIIQGRKFQQDIREVLDAHKALNNAPW